MKFNLINKIVLVTIISICTFSVKAQEIIDDDFLDNIEKNATPLWSDNTAAFTTSIIPAKYKDESAVVYGYKRNVTIDKKFRAGFLSKGQASLMFYENVHFKIKVNDKSAVKTFTEIYFRYSDKEDGFSAKVIKPSGVSNTVSLNDAVSIESSDKIPEFYQSFFDQEAGGYSRYFKVAIPDLEAGDILEYVAITKSKLNVNGFGYIEFSPQYEVCSKGYPVLFNQIGIELDDKSYFKSMALNGAPEFKKEAATSDEFYRYVFTDTDRPTEKDINFISTYLSSPLNKFQVIYANKEKSADKNGALIGQKGELKKSFTLQELTESAWETYAKVGKNYYNGYSTNDAVVDEFWKILKKAGAKDWEDDDFISKAYYRLRSTITQGNNYWSDRQFAYIFRSLLDNKKIKSDLVISTSNSKGKVKDILFDQEIKYATMVNGKLYCNATDYSNPNDLVENLLNNEAYIIGEPIKGQQAVTKITLPNATAKDNNCTYEVTSSLKSDMSTLVISRKNIFTGVSKTNHIYDALRYTIYTLDDYKYTGEEAPTEKMNSRQSDEYYKSLNEYKERLKELKPDFVKSELQSDFGNTVKYTNFSVESDGRYVKKQDLKYTEEFELTGMVRRAGKKLLINVAGLVGSQLQIKKEERLARNNDINVGYARSLFWIINFKIPDGYTAEGVKEMALEVTNETGTYAAVAEQVENTISIKIKKIYKQANMPKDKWQDMQKFVDAAYNNSFKYILLKRKG